MTSGGLAAVSSSAFAALYSAFGKYDVVHIHAEGPAFFAWLPKMFGKRVVVTVHGIDWQREKWQSGLGSKFIHQGEKNAAKYADEVIVLSKGVQDYFKETYGRKTHFIPNGVNRPQIREAKLIKDHFGLEKDSYILFLGRLVPEKGIRYLVEAFKNVKDKNHLIIDEYAAGIVQEIFKQKLNGMSSQRIASHLNELGVLPPNEYKRANGFNYTCGFQAGLNQKWTVVSVNRILKNESYTGTLIQGKRRKINYKVKKSHDVGSENWIRVEGAHDAIISKGEFQQVQQLLELDTRTAPSQTTVYPLSGFLRCADCGQNMIRRTVTKNGKKYQYYHCSTYKNGGGCTPHMINSEKLTESVLAAIRHQVTLLVEAEKVLSNAELASGEQIGIKILDSQITALEAELERYSNLKIRLYQDLCDDVVSREEYGEMNTRFAQKIKEAQDKIQEIREKKQEALKHDTLLPTWLEEFKQYEHIKTLERRVVVELIDHIDVHSKTEIEIHFCFEDELHSITEKFMEYQAHHGNEVAEE